jgi:hypothetical protein
MVDGRHHGVCMVWSCLLAARSCFVLLSLSLLLSLGTWDLLYGAGDTWDVAHIGECVVRTERERVVLIIHAYAYMP